MDTPQGPYLLVAALCEKVLHEQDGVASLIRVVDTVSHREIGPDAPEVMPLVTYPLYLLLTIKPGRALGRHQLIVHMRGPDRSEERRVGKECRL